MQILTQKQIRLLEIFGKEKYITDRFYLTGGTPLAAFYLGHRFSEDLDFFSEKELDILPLGAFLNSLKKDFEILKIDYEQSYNRNLYFLHFQDEVLKLEFTFFPFSRIEKGPMRYNVEIDSLLDIAVNKLFTVYQRTQARDYIDLYYICTQKGFTLSDLVEKARIKFDWHIDPIQLGTQFLKAGEAPDMPRLTRKFDFQDVSRFFTGEAKKLSGEVLE